MTARLLDMILAWVTALLVVGLPAWLLGDVALGLPPGSLWWKLAGAAAIIVWLVVWGLLHEHRPDGPTDDGMRWWVA